jgi:hypothetical protein
MNYGCLFLAKNSHTLEWHKNIGQLTEAHVQEKPIMKEQSLSVWLQLKISLYPT